jgi:signal transduction histidine kinase
MDLVITKAIESLQTQAARKDVEIIPTIEDQIKPVNGDETTLTEVLVNLISNAIKYSRGGSQILVKAKGLGNEVTISVIDFGVGIAKEDLPHLLDGFQIGKPGTAGERSSGIGLSVSKRIIEAHDGSLQVESEPGKGSTFIIRLPAIELPITHVKNG